MANSVTLPIFWVDLWKLFLSPQAYLSHLWWHGERSRAPHFVWMDQTPHMSREIMVHRLRYWTLNGSCCLANYFVLFNWCWYLVYVVTKRFQSQEGGRGWVWRWPMKLLLRIVQRNRRHCERLQRTLQGKDSLHSWIYSYVQNNRSPTSLTCSITVFGRNDIFTWQIIY